MLNKMQIIYEPFDLEKFDLDQPFEKYLSNYEELLSSTEKFDPQNEEEQDIFDDYVRTLSIIISNYKTLIEDVHKYLLLPRESLTIQRIVRRTRDSIVCSASTIQFREKDLSILAQTDALRIMKIRATESEDALDGEFFVMLNNQMNIDSIFRNKRKLRAPRSKVKFVPQKKQPRIQRVTVALFCILGVFGIVWGCLGILKLIVSL